MPHRRFPLIAAVTRYSPAILRTEAAPATPTGLDGRSASIDGHLKCHNGWSHEARSSGTRRWATRGGKNEHVSYAAVAGGDAAGHPRISCLGRWMGQRPQIPPPVAALLPPRMCVVMKGNGCSGDVARARLRPEYRVRVAVCDPHARSQRAGRTGCFRTPKKRSVMKRPRCCQRRRCRSSSDDLMMCPPRIYGPGDRHTSRMPAWPG